MHLPGRDADGPDGAVIVVLCFADGGGQPAHADAVAAHDGSVAVSLFIHILHVHGAAVFVAQLENVAHLDAAGDGQAPFAADRADAACKGLGKIPINRIRTVPFEVQSCQMPALFVCTAGKA